MPRWPHLICAAAFLFGPAAHAQSHEHALAAPDNGTPSTLDGHRRVFTDAGYGGIYTPDEQCIRENLHEPNHSPNKYVVAARVCRIVAADLTNDHELQFRARYDHAPYIITVKAPDGMDQWALCRPRPDAGPFHKDYGCQWLGVRSAPGDRATVEATLPRTASVE